MAKYQILTLNQISSQGLHRFPTARYSVGKSAEHPDAILVRSHDMHALRIPESVKAIGRAGAGTNNIPVAEMSKRGVPVFNAPGANANAVRYLRLNRSPSFSVASIDKARRKTIGPSLRPWHDHSTNDGKKAVISADTRATLRVGKISIEIM